MNSQSILICLSILILATASCRSSNWVTTIPPSNLTDTRLHVSYIRIQDFWNEHGKVPTECSELPEFPDRDCSMTDGWNRELHWESDGNHSVKVWSLGADGKEGGVGDNADAEVLFVGRKKHQDDFPEMRKVQDRDSR